MQVYKGGALIRIKRDVLDTLFSDYIRRRVYHDGQAACECCERIYYDQTKDNGDIYPAWKHLQCSHYYGRGEKGTRLCQDNCAALCFTCHHYLDTHPREHTEWMRDRIGQERLDRLTERANKGLHYTKVVKEELKRFWREKLKELE